MTIADVTRRTPYVGNGVSTSFATTFQFFECDVYLNGVKKTVGVHYTVFQASPGGTGVITFLTAPVAAAAILLSSNTSRVQAVDYVNNDNFDAEALEDALDRLTMIGGDLNDRVNDTNTAAASAAAALASQTAAAASQAAAAASAAAALASQTAAATSATNATASATSATASAAAALDSQTSATASATSATASATSATASATSATASATSATASATAAASSYDSFDDRYLGAKAADPSLDNDGAALLTGALYYSTTAGAMKVYSGSVWQLAYVTGPDVYSAITTTRGDIIRRNATQNDRLAIGTSGYALMSNGLDPAWTAFNLGVTGSVDLTWRAAASETVSVKQFGAKGDGSTDDTAAINAAIVYCNSLTRKGLHFPYGTYIVTGPLTALTGNNWDIWGAGIGATRIRQLSDATTFQLDPSASAMFYGGMRGMTITGVANAGFSSSIGIKVRGALGSATGLNYWAFRDIVLTDLDEGVRFEKTGSFTAGVFTAQAPHTALEFYNLYATPSTNPMQYTVRFMSGSGTAHVFKGGTFRGTVAAISIGDATQGIGDIIFSGMHIFSGDVGIDIYGSTGPSTDYNQNIVITGCQLDNLTTATVRFDRMQNFRYFNNNSTGVCGPVYTNCTNFWSEDRNTLNLQTPTKSHVINCTKLTLGAVDLTPGASIITCGGAFTAQGTSTANRFSPVGTISGTCMYLPVASTIGIAAAGVDAARFLTAASGVNYHTLQGAATGVGPLHAVDGPATDIPYRLSGKGTGVVSVLSALQLSAGTTARAPINFTSGVAPTSPVNGDVWFDGTEFKTRVGGVTKTFTIA